MSLVVVGAFLTSVLWADVAGAEHWSTSTNPNAQTGDIATYNMKFPVVGYAMPGGNAHATDDFCYAGNTSRPYSTWACITELHAHRGLDIYPVAGSNSLGVPQVGGGVLPVVAARSGTVTFASCRSGAGYEVIVLGDDGIYYHYLHMQSGLSVSAGNSVRAGQRLGLMGNWQSCSGGTTAVHLHFELRIGGDDEYLGPRDPYPSVKNRFTRPGYAAVANNNAQTPNGLLTTAWRNAIAGNYAGNIAMVGWPASSTQSNGYVANPDWYYTSSYCGSGYACNGYKQFLGTGDGGFDGRGMMRAGVLTQRSPQNGTAYWVHGLIYKRYSNMAGYDTADEEDSWLGWPTSYEFKDSRGMTRQNFEGGCITKDSAGAYVPARYGQYPCNY